jgi:para-aminobenzoate synthetase
VNVIRAGAPPEVPLHTLIIDNHDSFTHNLAHYVAQVNGRDPVVVPHDDRRWTTRELRHFDNVVISPGPGRPDRPADFGICADVIRAATVPLLGVCLGHQGICHVFGGRIGPAPELFHGRQSSVEHRGDELFAGVPSPFAAVRYHSLAATALPAELEPVAWTTDGLLMAVRHRHRPIWGVQFHPESVCTDHGLRIVANFADITRRCRPQRRRPPARRPTAPPRPSPTHRVVTTRLSSDVRPDVVFDALYRDAEHGFWLDSSSEGGPTGRFSFMGDASGPLARVVTADVWTRRVEVTGAAAVEGGFFDWLEADLARHTVDVPDLPFDFALGWVGYLGYELKAESGGERAHRSAHPDAAMIFADRAVAFDHREGEVHLLALAEVDDVAPALHWLRRTEDRVAALAAQHPPAATPPTSRPVGFGEPRLRHGRQRYLELIAACRREIEAGETYEVCLTNLLTADLATPDPPAQGPTAPDLPVDPLPASGAFDPVVAYRWLRDANPVPFAALLRLGSLSVLSCSPERFLRVGTDGRVQSRPIKGTRPRSDSPEQDERLRRELAGSVKDRAENLMIVDLVRNDLARCSEVGSVRVDRLFDVETYATVHQLVSTVSARLRPDCSSVRCVRAAFPGGSMTGAPKVRTMRIIDGLEGGPRGVYSGALGYFSLSGAVDLSIVIRTVVAVPGRVEFGIGGAVTVLSDADEEFEETAVKAAALLGLLGVGFPGRVAISPAQVP